MHQQTTVPQDATLKHEPPDGDTTRRPSRRQLVILGIVLLWTSGAGWVLIYADTIGGLTFSLPAVWYHSPAICLAALVALTVAGAVLVGGDWPRSLPVEWRPVRPGRRFHEGRFYFDSRDAAHTRLGQDVQRHAAWFESLELVDVAHRPEQVPPGCRCLPALEIDGRLRFRGDFRVELLRRLIQATPPLDSRA